MRTETINICQYSELSEKAKQRAREWYTGDGFYFHDDFIFDDFTQICDILGIDLSDSKNRSQIYYRLAYSQGDGACFNGTYEYKTGALLAIKDHAPLDTTLQDIAVRLQAAQKKMFYKTRVKITHSGGYCHAYSMDYEFSNDLHPNLDDESEPCRAIIECMRDLAKWLYAQIQNEYEYQTSDTAVAENIEANEYEFLESGKRA
jgi:hypothetical protein